MTNPAPFDWSTVDVRGVLDLTREADVLAELDAACLVDGALQVMPASFYEKTSQHDLSLWCIRRGFYCLPTVELVDFIRAEINGAEAIEIGSGNGVLGRALGIRRTDSRQQERASVQEHYQRIDHAVVSYGADVEQLTALEAVEKYKPRVVVAAWVTHRYDPRDPKRDGNMFGVDEGKLIAKKCVRKYIFVGHERVHAKKPLLDRRHKTYWLPFLHSRSFDRRNVVWIWG